MANEELIRENMERTRESLTEKLETLESKVMGSVTQATTAVNETVNNVKETMHEGVESIKDAVDIPAHVERHPWLMLGGAVLTGYALSTILLQEKKPYATRKFTLTPEKTPPDPPPAPLSGASREETSSSLFSALEPEIKQLRGLALGVTFGTVRELVAKEAPPHLADQLRAIVDSVTMKMGGAPLAPGDLPFTDANADSARSCETHG
jgi:hypothetical protein